MEDKIFDHVGNPRSYSASHPQIISADAARGGPLCGRLLVMMIGAVLLCAVASAVIGLIY
jgi:hypothetical protein